MVVEKESTLAQPFNTIKNIEIKDSVIYLVAKKTHFWTRKFNKSVKKDNISIQNKKKLI